MDDAVTAYPRVLDEPGARVTGVMNLARARTTADGEMVRLHSGKQIGRSGKIDAWRTSLRSAGFSPQAPRVILADRSEPLDERLSLFPTGKISCQGSSLRIGQLSFPVWHCLAHRAIPPFFLQGSKMMQRP